MPRYFFDIHNGDGPSRDEHGMELASDRKIMQEMSRIALDIARDELPGQERGEISIFVRDDGGREVCSTHLSFRTEWKRHAEV
ncbi:hypothetical protein J2T09_001495 [Neorhizobium huautlense]|uniref:DUF6894 domain-containing protein n=1 Tax=Neorhizobium huautlense TaxID=67774 RepID=A0ABT9PRB1_9HYPH|nr:hypothetical protein [Neorhizobium huautlense]MDP9836750.1 hypothetical protein [Neorhizobium huautlense]